MFILKFIVAASLTGFSHQCTEIILRGEDGSITLGRTLDYDIDVIGAFYTEPRGTNYEAVLNPLPDSCKNKGLKWTSLYKAIHIRPTEKELRSLSVDGINDAGLTATVLSFDGYAKYSEISEANCKSAISQCQVAGYILAMFSTVKEVREAFDMNNFPEVASSFMIGNYIGCHYSVTDKSGDAIVIEYTSNGRAIHDNIVGVMTNHPAYEWHMTNLQSYVHLQNTRRPERKYQDPMLNDQSLPKYPASGILGMPGDYTSPSRFVRAAHLVRYAETPKTTEDAVISTFHILNSVDVTIGTVEGRIVSTRTNWQLVKDLQNGCLYYRTYDFLSVRKLCLPDVPDKPSYLLLDKNVKNFQDGVEDMTGRMRYIKTEL